MIEASIIEEVVIDLIAEDYVQRRRDAKRLRDFLELDVLSPLLAKAMDSGPEAMGRWWALRFELQPTIASLRLIEAGKIKAAADYWSAVTEFESNSQIPAGIALAAGWKPQEQE